jgi:branched-chain amino acid transport system permease protein
VFKEYEMVLLGAVLMLTMIFMPRGLVPTLERALAAARAKHR